jgi:hypothetical protein
VKPWVTLADVLTSLRGPLAVLFPLPHRAEWQLGAVALVAVSDVFDGILAAASAARGQEGRRSPSGTC